MRGPQHRQPQQAYPGQENIGEHHCAQFPKPHARTGVKVQVLGVPHGCEHASQIGRKCLQDYQGHRQLLLLGQFQNSQSEGYKGDERYVVGDGHAAEKGEKHQHQHHAPGRGSPPQQGAAMD